MKASKPFHVVLLLLIIIIIDLIEINFNTVYSDDNLLSPISSQILPTSLPTQLYAFLFLSLKNKQISLKKTRHT